MNHFLKASNAEKYPFPVFRDIVEGGFSVRLSIDLGLFLVSEVPC